MVNHHLTIEAGHCYRTTTGDLRLVLGVTANIVSYAVLFMAGGWTSQGPAERLPLDKFSQQAESDVHCPAVTPPTWP